MHRNNWIVDVALLILIAAMGGLIYSSLNHMAVPNGEDDTQPTEGNPTQTEEEAPTATIVFNYSGDRKATAPVFTLKDLEGDTVNLSDYLESPVMINFWATWCLPCEAEMLIIQGLVDAFPGEFFVLAVNAGEEEDKIREFILGYDFDFTILLDPDKSASSSYNVSEYPTSVFVDENGIIRRIHIGELTEELLTTYLQEIGVGQ